MKGRRDTKLKEGGDMIHNIESNTHYSGRSKEQERYMVAMMHDEAVEGWGTIILSIFIGLLALWFFLALGGLVALVGPLLILVVRYLLLQKWVRKRQDVFVDRLARLWHQFGSTHSHAVPFLAMNECTSVSVRRSRSSVSEFMLNNTLERSVVTGKSMSHSELNNRGLKSEGA
jgi:hypothetical protein